VDRPPLLALPKKNKAHPPPLPHPPLSPSFLALPPLPLAASPPFTPTGAFPSRTLTPLSGSC
jgi:hypothetical protein